MPPVKPARMKNSPAISGFDLEVVPKYVPYIPNDQSRCPMLRAAPLTGATRWRKFPNVYWKAILIHCKAAVMLWLVGRF